LFQRNPKTHLDAHLRAARLDERLHESSKPRAINNEVLDWATVPQWLGGAQKKLAEMSDQK
jgi:hypothetical protein